MTGRREVVFDGTWRGWRRAARACLAEGISPERVSWVEPGASQGSLFATPQGGRVTPAPPVPVAGARGPVPRSFLTSARRVACHREPARWDLLYRLVWRLTGDERGLWGDVLDDDVRRARALEKAVRRDVHKMRAFVRFRRTEDADGERWLAWFEPDHHIVDLNARFFVERFTSMRFSIFTPDRSMHWDRSTCWFGGGARAADVRGADGLERLWRTYFASTYNPARTRVRAMRSEMPMKYWKNLPEADLIPVLVRGAAGRVERLLEAPPALSVAEQRAARRERGTPVARSSERTES